MQTSRGLGRRDSSPLARYGATGPSVKASPVQLLHLFLSCVISPHVCLVPLYCQCVVCPSLPVSSVYHLLPLL